MSNNTNNNESEFELEWIELRQKMDERKHKNEEQIQSRMWNKMKANPLVPIGVLTTVFCLSYGLIALRRGDSRTQQIMMRGRVAAQGFTVFALISGIMYSLKTSAEQ